jgi:hypothetical protein
MGAASLAGRSCAMTGTFDTATTLCPSCLSCAGAMMFCTHNLVVVPSFRATWMVSPLAGVPGTTTTHEDWTRRRFLKCRCALALTEPRALATGFPIALSSRIHRPTIWLTALSG